jgi:type IV pilus assembly protein PilM
MVGNMSLISGINDFFGLDIGNTGVRVVQLRGNTGLKTLQHYGFAPVEKALAQSDAAVDQQKLAQTIKELLMSAGITTSNVAVGLPSNKVFTTLVDMDRLEESEISKAIQYQADSLIPTPLADSKLDWAVVGDSPLDKSKVEVLLTIVTN